MTIRLSHLCCTIVLLAVASSAQSVRHVPANYPSIQSAINAAVNGDIVLVQPGNYVGDIDFLGKNIIVRGAAGALATTIVGSGTAPVVRIVSPTVASIPGGSLVDLTITNGHGASLLPQPFSGIYGAEAGGIEVRAASPTILRCRVIGNTGGASPVTGTFSGATQAGPGGISVADSTHVIDCLIAGNTGGAGLNNVAIGGGYDTVGGNGGAGGIQTQPYASNVVISGCTIENNIGGDAGSSAMGFFSKAGPGGVRLESFLITQMALLRCRISQNQAGNFSLPGLVGTGGVYGQRVFCMSCIFDGNSAGSSSGTFPASPGAATFLSSTVDGCTFFGNIGAVGSTPALSAAGALMVDSGTVTRNSILWDNVDGNGGTMQIKNTNGGSAAITRSIVQGGTVGLNISTADPLFVNTAGGDFRLSPGSPAIDAFGPPIDVFAIGSKDAAGNPRWLGVVPDYGALESGAYDSTKLGTGEDFEIMSRRTGFGSPSAVDKNFVSSGQLGVTAYSPATSMIDRYPIIIAEVFNEGAPPTQWYPAFPEIHWGSTAFVVLDGPSFAVTLNPPPPLFYSVPTGLTGLVVRFQAIALDPRAKNGVFAASDAHDIHFQ